MGDPAVSQGHPVSSAANIPEEEGSWTSKRLFQLAAFLQRQGNINEEEFLSLMPPARVDNVQFFDLLPCFPAHEPLPFLGPMGIRFEEGQPKFAAMIFFRM